MNFPILLSLIFLIITIIVINYTYHENFDARVSDVDKSKCGDMCTKIYGCNGFAYDDNQKCYLSQSPIIGSPMESLYRNEYDPAFEFCNKPHPIKDEIDEKLLQALPKNTIYTCQVGDEGVPKYQSILNDNITDVDMKESVISVKKYDLKLLTWPFEKKDIDANYTNIDDHMNKIIMYDYDPDNEYQGSYIYAHKCVNNIPLFNCLTKCATDENCVGLEYNPLLLRKLSNGKYKKDRNVCCLKSSEFNKIKRTTEHENGAYYKKSLEDGAYLSNIYIRNTNK